MPKVSVVIPVYGVEKYIERCVRSLFEQTLADIEYLFIDDCSPDKSIDVLKTVVEEYPNRRSQVTIHRMPQNSGQAAVRKWGVQHSRGEYVIHCDSDDWVDTTAYEIAYEMAKKDNLDILTFDYKKTDGEEFTNISNSFSKDKYSAIRDLMLAKAKASLCMSLVRRELYFNESFRFPESDMTEDFATIVQLLYLSKSYGHLSLALYNYYQNTSSITKVESIDKCLKRYHDTKNNSLLLKEFFQRTDEHNFDKELKINLFASKLLLKSYTHKWNVYKIWMSHYPQYTLSYLTDDRVQSDRKKVVLLASLGLFGLLKCKK